MWAVIWGSVASAVFAAGAAVKLMAGEVSIYFRTGAGATGIGASSSLALIGAGHLMGITVGNRHAGRPGHRLGASWCR